MRKYETCGAKEWDRSRKIHKQVIKRRRQRQAESREAADNEPEAGPHVPYVPKERNKESLTIEGTECHAQRAPAQYAEQEAQTLLMPYGGDVNNLIDRFDARAMLPGGITAQAASRSDSKKQSASEAELLLNLCRWEDIVWDLASRLNENGAEPADIAANAHRIAKHYDIDDLVLARKLRMEGINRGNAVEKGYSSDEAEAARMERKLAERRRLAMEKKRELEKQRQKSEKKAVGSVAGAKETPQERLKRIMNAQLNRQIKKNQTFEADKKQRAEEEREERELSRRQAMTIADRREPSYGRRSRSPRRYRSSSRSRGSRDRSISRSSSRSRSRRRRSSRSRSTSFSSRSSSRSRSRSLSRDSRSRSRS